MSEIWKDIEEYEGLYQVSNLGRVKSYYGKNGRLIKYPKILEPGTDKDGYLKITLCKNKKYKYKKAHQLVAQTFIPNIENKPCVNHIDGNKLNNRVENLEWCNHEQNIQHAHKTGLHKGCRTKVLLSNSEKNLEFNSITEASNFLQVDRHMFNNKRKRYGNKFNYKNYEVTLIGGKQGGKR